MGDDRVYGMSILENITQKTAANLDIQVTSSFFVLSHQSTS